MKRLLRITIMLITILAPMAHAQPYQTGLAKLQIQDPKNNRDLGGFIWYPTDQKSGQTKHHTNAVWVGIDAIEDAKPASGTFPLLVLSHGMYGNAMNQTWLAGEMAKRGYIVAAINHPGTSSWLRDPDDSRQLWERSKDISRVIDYFVNTPDLDVHIDKNRIFMAGHSLGGFTAVGLAGGRYDTVKMDKFCADHLNELVCNIFKQWHIAQTPEDIESMQADLSDSRIKGFVVLDLGGTQTFSKGSLSHILKPMLVIGAPYNMGHGLDLDIESRALITALPKNNVHYLEPEMLSHFDFLGECQPNATEFLKTNEPDDVFICMQGTKERREKHQMLVNTIVAFFEKI